MKRRAIQLAFRICDLPLKLLKGNQTATYFGTLTREHQACLRHGKSPKIVTGLDIGNIMHYWRQKWLPKAQDRLNDATKRIENGGPLSKRLSGSHVTTQPFCAGLELERGE
jgi:hypothetical protein